MNQVIKKQQACEYAKSNLNQIMEQRGLGVRELARATDNTAMTVSRLCSQGRLPSVDCLLRITEYLGISMETLFSSTEKTTKKEKTLKN